jgi:heptosyltransferase I
MHSPAPERLCLIRLSALGDVCHAVALVRALQRIWPQTQITWIIGTKEAPLVSALPNVHFITYDKSSNLKSARAIGQQLKDIPFDVLVVAQTSLRANLLSRFIRAKRRVGFGGDWAREGHGLFVNEQLTLRSHSHQAEAIFEFARYLTGQASLSLIDEDRGLPISEESRVFAREHQPQPKHAVLISPCSSHPRRNWTAEGYAQVSDWIVSEAKRPVILVGGVTQIEKQMGEAIESAMQCPVTNLIGKDTLPEALAMLERAAVLITPDSGPAHMADGLQTPVVGLYAATRVASSGPFASQAHCVDQFEEAARRFRGREPSQLPWLTRIEAPGVMNLITPDQVIAKLQPLLLT